MRLRLPLPPNFHFDAIVRSHGWYDLPPFAYDAKRSILTTSVADRSRAIPISFQAKQGKLEVISEGIERRRLAVIASRVFSLNIHLEESVSAFSGDGNLTRALARGGGRMLRGPTVFEDAVKVLFTTNCSWEATRGMVARLIALAGNERQAFPSPSAVASFSPARLKARVRCGYRAESLSRLSRRVASGKLDLSRWEDPTLSSESLREAILAEHGFGPYAAENLLRIFGRHDFLALDSWVRQKYRKLYPGKKSATDGSIARRYQRFGAFRGLALWLDMTRDWHEEKERLWPRGSA